VSTQRTATRAPAKLRTPAKPRAPAGARAAASAIRREQILAAALTLFCEHGYAATSTRRIAEAAGVTEGLIFHHFPSKEALLLELAAQRHTFAGQALTVVQQAGDRSARELLQAFAAGLTGVSGEEAAFVGFMLAEAQVNPVLRGHITAATAVVMDGLVQTLARRVATGELRQDASLSAAGHGFFGGFLFFFTQHRHLGAAAWRREAAAFAEAWADQCWRGIATPAALSKHSTNAKTSASPRTRS
jgi:AcrR family transcriptional regulator